jgi:hypothetical protein
MVGIIISPMGRRVIRGLVLLAGILAVLCPQPAGAFPSLCKEGRLPSPFPTFAEEIRELNAGQPVTGFVVGDLQLEGDIHGREAVRKRILRELQKCEFESESDLLAYGTDIGISGFFQDHGYFDAEVSVEARPLDIRNNQQRMFLIAHVKEGDQFRLGRLMVIPSDPNAKLLRFKESAYKQWFALHEGDIVDAGKVRDWVERITGVYGRFGHADATIEPSFDLDHRNKTISIVLKITEGPRYMLEAVEARGLSPKAEGDLRKLVTPGSLYNQSVMEKAIKPNIPPSSPCHPETVAIFVRNFQQGTARVILDFRNCSPPTN